MTQSEQSRAAKEFAENWKGKGYEKGECNKFWLDLLSNVFSVKNFANYIEFEKTVKISNTSFIDAYIPQTKVLIEQKGLKINLDEKEKQSDGTELTPYEQAKRYFDNQGLDKKPRWIIVCNFAEFRVYDMNLDHPEKSVQKILLADLEKEYYRLQFLVNTKNEHIQREEDISTEAGKLVARLYDALILQYADQKNPQTLKSLNALCVRLVFCLYAEDAGLFGSKSAFHDYMLTFNNENFRTGLIELFKTLDTEIEKRDPYLKDSLKAFPYVNGGLFAEEKIEIPRFTDEIIELLLEDCSAKFDWSEISPTIFGAVFESTLNPETRRSGGMHYTSIENIHKVIDNLFMYELNGEFNSIKSIPQKKERETRLLEFQQKISSLKFLDPACGSGNFLTESYISLRRLENEIIKLLYGKEKMLALSENLVRVSLSQFYGIEINDFAVSVAKAALWIAESQMTIETEKIIDHDMNFLPLKNFGNIVEGNALELDWSTLKASANLGELFEISEQGSGGRVQEKLHFDYIMGNPPFVGYSLQSEEQKKSILKVYVDENGKPYKTAGKIDFVAAWYFKAAKLIQGTNTKCALVSTNSITQGEQVEAVFKPLYERFGFGIDFAYRTFRWDSESFLKAHVHCVIVGFSWREDTPVLEIKTLVVESKKLINDDKSVIAPSGKFYKGHYLPHWHKDGVLQFITFRLDDSLPQEVLKEIQAEKDDFEKQNPKPWNDDVQEKYHEKFTDKIEKYLEAGYGSCILVKREFQKEIVSTLLYDNGKKYKLHSFVIMPNHVHVLVEMLAENKTCEVVKQWKGISARRINQLQNKKGTIWQSDYFDRMIRNEKHYKNVLNYIENNKAKGDFHYDGRSDLYYDDKSVIAPKFIFDENGERHEAKNINPYLVDAPNIFIESRAKPLCDVPKMTTGNRPADGGHLIIEANEYEDFIKKEPNAKKYIKNLLGSEEFINGKKRYCLWLVGASPAELRKMPLVMERIEKCRQDRLSSPDAGRQKLAQTPMLFRETMNPESYIVVPKVSSERRNYIPMGFLNGDTISTDLNFIIPNATLYEFGVLTSSVHMAWTRAVCGRLEMRYRYSKDIVYNNFVWPLGTTTLLSSKKAGTSKAQSPLAEKSEDRSFRFEDKSVLAPIAQTAQQILAVRAKFPDCSLADLYDENTMPPELRHAHNENDKAVMQAYGFSPKMSESEIVAELMEMYQMAVKLN